MPSVEPVLVRYCTAIDTKQWDIFRSCFDTQVAAVYSGRPYRDLDALAAYMIRVHADLDTTMHRLTNVEACLDGDLARSRSYVDALLVQHDHPLGPCLHVAGTYHDELRLVDGAWRITRREFELGWRDGNTNLIQP